MLLGTLSLSVHPTPLLPVDLHSYPYIVVTIGFSKNEYVINEGSLSEAMVTLQASGDHFEQPIIVSISTHDISTQGELF